MFLETERPWAQISHPGKIEHDYPHNVCATQKIINVKRTKLLLGPTDGQTARKINW